MNGCLVTAGSAGSAPAPRYRSGPPAGQPASEQPTTRAARQLGRKREAQLVDELCRHKARVEPRPSLAEDVPHAPVPEFFQSRAQVDRARPGREYLAGSPRPRQFHGV